MKVVDLNLLLYAVNADSPHHDRARRWWDAQLREDVTIGLPWAVLLGFLRISTRGGIFPAPLATAQALDVIEGWLDHPSVVPLTPGPTHWQELRKLVEAAGTAGNLTTDAHLAALAIEYGAVLVSSDNDFARFEPALRFENPLKST